MVRKSSVGFLPIGDVASEGIKKDHWLAIQSLKHLDVELVELPLQKNKVEITTIVKAVHNENLDLLLLLPLEGMSA